MQDTTTEPITVDRTGLPPIRFAGTEIGSGSTGGLTRWTAVTIYKTKGGGYVTQVENLTIWQGERDYSVGNSHETAREAIFSLADEDGKLGRASQEAIERAVKADPAFAAAWMEDRGNYAIKRKD